MQKQTTLTTTLTTILTTALILVPAAGVLADSRPQVRLSKQTVSEQTANARAGLCFVEKQQELSRAELAEQRVKETWGIKSHRGAIEFEQVACADADELEAFSFQHETSTAVKIGTLVGTRG